MRILWLFILFGVGILNITSVKAAELSSEKPFSGSASGSNAEASALSSITVSNYAGAAYFFGPSDRSIWTSTTNAVGPPDDTGSLSFIFPSDTSRYLYLRNFNFNVPCNAIIESITVTVRRRNRSTVDLTDETVATFNPVTLALGSLNMADPSLWETNGTWENVVYTDMTWGETLTPELINDSRFGLVISAWNNNLVAGRSEALVDAVEMEVCYALTGSPSTPITYSLDKVDACYGEGSITVNALGGSGSFEYSIDGGMSWQSSNYFGGLSQDDYTIIVRNSDMTCQTEPVNCNLSADERILQAGDGVITCATYPGNRVTLGVEKLQPLNELYLSGDLGYDISSIIGPHSYKWDVDEFGGEVFSTAIDPERNIYTATTIMYDLSPGAAIPVNVARIEAYSGEVHTIATLPGDAGAAGVEYQNGCDQLFVANLSDGIIYRLDPITGATLSTFDPNSPDNGAPLIAPLGERILSVAYNPVDSRLYYSIWASDYNRTGIRNTIRSVTISPATCDFVPASDQLEITLPWISEYGDTSNPENFSMPVADMEFSSDGGTLIMSESGFDSSVPATKPHEARVLKYDGSSGSWTLDTTLPAGNTNMQFEFGEVSAGLNARGGIAFANSGFSGFNCTVDDDQFIIGTADALRGADCNTLGCIYGLQYLPITGGKSTSSVLVDVGRDLESQQKSVFGDIDMVSGCPEPLYCCPDLDSSEPDIVVCPGDVLTTFTATSQADSISLVYHTSVPTDSAAVYTDGTALDTANVIGGSATLSLAGLDVSSPITYYVYVITHPTSDLVYCRPYDSIVVTVRNLPTVSLNDPSDRCITGLDMSFSGSPLPVGMQSATFSSDAPGGFVDNGDGTADIDISVAGPGTYTIEYTFTDEFGCFETASTDVTIYDQPTVSISDPGDICIGASTLNFTGSPAPAPGTSGFFSSSAAGLTDNGDGTASVDPGVSGIGSYNISYTYTDINGCVNTASTTFAVLSLPIVDVTGPLVACVSDGSLTFNGSPLPGLGVLGSFTSDAPAGLIDNGDGSASLDLSLSGAGTFDINYLLTDLFGCVNIATTTVEVFDTLPEVTLVEGFVCGDPTFGSNILDLNTLISVGPLGGIWVDLDGTGALSGSVFVADPTMEGNTYNFSYTITGPGPLATDCQIKTFGVSVTVGYCYLDLALIKTTTQSTPVIENDLVQFDITICNQGFIAVDSIEITDYLAPCYGFTPNNGWVSSGPDAVITLLEGAGLPIGGLPPASASPANCITIPLELTVDCGVPADLIAYAEITGNRDVDGNTDDFDSTPGSNSIAENSVLPGSADDDSFNDLNEDDHDPGVMPVADIALRNQIVSSGPYSYGQSVNFNIELFNQGNIDLYDIEVTDYIPCGFAFNASNSPQWTDFGSVATTTISRLDAGQSTSVNILLDIQESPGICSNASSWLNEAEVSQLLDSSSSDISSRDYDSVINNIQGDDAGGAAGSGSDDSISGDGTGAVGGTNALTDEDDHDPALFELYDLTVSKAETSVGPYGPDSIVTFQIVIENQGGMAASNIEVRDYPEMGLQFVGSDAGSNGNVDEITSRVWNVLSLAPGASEIINLDFIVASGFQDLNLYNRVQITADDGDDIDSDPAFDFTVDEDGDLNPFDDDEDEVLVNIAQFYDLSISKTEASTGPYFQGSLITYDITVFNDGTLNASNIVIQDVPGTGLGFVADNSFLNGNVTALGGGQYSIASIDFGDSESFQVSYAIDNSYQDTIVVNRVMITQDDGDDYDSDPSTGFTVDEDGDLDPFDDDEDEIELDVIQTYDLAIFKTELSSGPYYQGDIISYRIEVANQGSLNASNIEIEDIPDANMIFVSDNSGSNSNVTGISPLQYRIQSIPFGTSEFVDISFQVNPTFQGDTVSNITQIILDDGDDLDSDPDVDYTLDEDGDFDGFDDDEDFLDIEIQQIYDLRIAKTLLTTGDIYPGDPVNFRIDIINEGTLDASGIEITEDPDPGLLYLSNTSSMNPNITELNPALYQVSAIPAGGSESFEISYNVDNAYLNAQINNIVRISLDDGDDIDSDPSLDETVDEDGDGNGYDDDEALSVVGLYVGFNIGDYVWEDLNGDGIQSFGEPGIADLKVEIFNSRGFLVERVYTDASGYYNFEEILPGDYYIRFDLADGTYYPTREFAGFDPGSDSDVTGDNGPGTTSMYYLDSDNLGIDAGLIRCANIGGTVWFDYNQNDRQDGFENGINGMTVELYRLEPLGWTLWRSMETGHNEDTPSDDGFYKFCVQPGQYYLRFVNPPETLVPVIPGRGSEEVDSDVTGRFGYGTTDDFFILSGGEMCDIGAGYYIMGTIGDYIWHDSNGNGMHDPYEQGVQGVVVNAVNSTGEIVATAVSEEDGSYMLDYLGRDEYYIQIEEPLGWALSQPNVGNDDSLDSDIDGSNGYGTSAFFPVEPGTHTPNVDAGLVLGILPVEWIGFEGSHKGNYNRLEWYVTSEVNVEKYIIERAKENSFDFEPVGVVSYNYSSEDINSYAYYDYDIDTELSHYQYRIKQIDFDGRFMYSRIISIDMNGSDEQALSVDLFPNPAVDFIYIKSSYLMEDVMANMEITDIQGKVVLNRRLNSNDLARIHQGEYRLQVQDIPSGIYFVNISNEDYRQTVRVFISER